MLLGSKTGKESISCEYKEFCIKISTLPYNKNEILQILNNGKLSNKYNSIVYQSLEFYFHNILPKYISSYLNANTHGNFYIGINDFGEITGIPILNNINYKLIHNFFHYSISSFLSNFNNIFSYVSLSIIPLTINKTFLNNNEFYKLYNNYLTRFNKKIAEYDNFYTLKQKWLNNISKYEKKINYLLNTTYFRLELSDFIHISSLSSNDKNNLINMLKSTQILCYIHEDKANHQTITYWSCKYKDHILAELLKNRPIKPNVPIRIHPELIFLRTTPLRLHFINNNNNINYFIIKVHIKKYNGNNVCYYKYPYSDDLHCKIRRINTASQPFCSNF